MRMLVLGAGLQGSACAWDILEHTDADVTVADYRVDELHDALCNYNGDRLQVIKLDVRDDAAVRATMQEHDVALSAIPYYYNFSVARLAVDVGIHFADLGGNTEIVRQQETLDAAAKEHHISVVPDCGLAPGMVNVIAAEGIRRVESAETVKLFVGGLPRHPEPPLNYQVLYSLEGALDYYTTPSWILRNGRPIEIDALSEVEEVTTPEPLGTLEAFHTGGGASTMPWRYQDKVQSMEYKTLRYPGHASIMVAMRGLGLLGTDPVEVNGKQIVPRDAFIAIVDPVLRKPDSEDLVVLKVVVVGERKGRRTRTTFDLVDYADRENGMSAMMRVTGFSLAITGVMQVEGRIETRGVAPAYVATPYADYLSELRKRGIHIKEKIEELS